MVPEGPRRPFPLGRRAVVLGGILLAGVCAALSLDLSGGSLFTGTGLDKVLDFFSHAFSPALAYEEPVSGAPPLLWATLDAARKTIIFAAAAMSLSLVIGIVLGLLPDLEQLGRFPTIPVHL